MNKNIITIISLAVSALPLAQHGSAQQATPPSSWDLYPATVKADRSLAFDFTADGESKPILWGFDTAWNDEGNMIRGIRHTGADIIGVARVSFNPWDEITEKGVLPASLQKHLDNRMRTVGLIGHKVDIALNLDAGEPTIKELYGGLDENDNYIGDPVAVADNYARLIDATAAAVEAKGYRVVSAAPFNEPDYFWNGTPINVFNEINKRLKNYDEYPRFRNIRISGGNTLNCDQALPWYTELKEYLDEGNTHQLAGDFDHYADFFSTVRADGKYATADELHNVMEAMVGVEYGMQTGIWWGTAEQARGEFCKASGGKRLAYAENRKAWSSAAVYRAPSGKIQGFAGCSERQARPSTYRFISLDGDMYVDGRGPLREYVLDLPGDPNGAYQSELQRTAETVINITRGSDVQPLVDGSYAIVNDASHLALGIGDAAATDPQRIEQQTYTASDGQLWTVNPVPYDIGGDFSYYFIRNTADGRAFDDLNWNLNVGGEVIAYSASNASVQQWALEYDGNGFFHIRNKHSALYLEVADNAAGTLVLQQERRDIPGQRWRLLPAGAPLDFDAPATPDGLTATARSVSASLSWHAVADAASYTLLRAEAGSDEYNTIARDITATEFFDNSISAGKEYSYKVIAVDASLNRSEPSAAVTLKSDHSGLVACYGFDGSLDDSSANTFHARALRVEPEYTDEAGTQSLRFRANQRVQLPYSVMQQGGSFTVAMRACRLSVADGLYIFSTGTDENNCFNMSLCENGQLRLSAASGNQTGEISATAPELKQWIHVAATVDTDGKTATLYVDGIPAGTSAELAAAIPANRLLTYLGGGQDLNKLHFNGMIRDLNIYNRVLGAEEIATLASASAGIDGIDTVRHIVNEEYFDARGIRLTRPAVDGSLTIIRTTWSDGSVTTGKRR